MDVKTMNIKMSNGQELEFKEIITFEVYSDPEALLPIVTGFLEGTYNQEELSSLSYEVYSPEGDWLTSSEL